MNAVDMKVCTALIRSELAGYQGYPKSKLGEDRFARALQEVAISVEHATAIVSQFTEEFPTVQNIIDTSLNLRPKFQQAESDKEKWEREYGTPQPIEPDFSIMAGQRADAAKWAHLKRHFTTENGFPGWNKISQRAVHQAEKDLGYEVTGACASWYGIK